MKGFFDSPEAQAALLAEEKSWEGTKFWSGTRARAVKGVVADCFSYVVATMRNTGAVRGVKLPRYTATHGGPELLDRLIRWVDALPETQIVWLDSEPIDNALHRIRVGDIVLVSEDRSRHHAGIYMGNNSISHCWPGHGVCEGNLHDTNLLRNLVRVWRIMKTNEQQDSQPD